MLAPADSYRLCPATEPLTEACFQAHPLDFVQDKQALVLPNGTKVPIGMHAVFTNVGTSPLGSWWARLPIPAGGLGPRCSCDMNVNYKPGDFKCGCRESARLHCVRHPRTILQTRSSALLGACRVAHSFAERCS